MTETPHQPSPQDGTPPATAVSRRAVTAGTAPAGTAGEATHPAGGSASVPSAGPGTGRRGVLLGLVSAGAAAVAGAAVSAWRERAGDRGTRDAVAATGRTVEATLQVEGMRFVPDTVEVHAGDRLVLTLDNTSDQVHDLVLDTGATTGRVPAGGSARLDAGVVAGPLQGWCSIAGHRAQGMVMQVVTGAGAGSATDPGHAGHVGHADPAGAAVDLQAPLPEGFTSYEAALAPAPAESVHRVTLTVTEVEQAYVGAGAYQTRWTYNGTAPGPVLRGRVGDTFEVTLVNEGTMSHSVDFHAGIVSPDEPMRSIGPGESLVYTFTAQHSGIWLYHCSTAPMSLHLASGMYGAVVIDPDGLGEADREYLLIQSETYLGLETDAQGVTQVPTALTDKIAAKAPDLVCFNGVAFQYALAPLQARAGERVRWWVLDAGPSLPTSFHVVGLQLDTVFAEGSYLLGGPQGIGRSWHGGSQALALQPAQGGFVEAVVPAPGHYAMVTHVFADMEKGAKGVLEVS
ncbi:multicopper oxidase domain-containing protein [Actinomyces faecalis]|uniref:multicopper oxidase domain-containing protein n=1 Tax=Actinomyces faecalis TaxID=2722820 RepID=UPI001558275E|nr:multicopper oxidase domain-containing protein [Actinomyces faecalis]